MPQENASLKKARVTLLTPEKVESNAKDIK